MKIVKGRRPSVMITLKGPRQNPASYSAKNAMATKDDIYTGRWYMEIEKQIVTWMDGIECLVTLGDPTL